MRLRGSGTIVRRVKELLAGIDAYELPAFGLLLSAVTNSYDYTVLLTPLQRCILGSTGEVGICWEAVGPV